MHHRYFIYSVELPRQASALWGTDLDGDMAAVERVAGLLSKTGLDRCSFIEVAATIDGNLGLREDAPEHQRIIANVFSDWSLFDAHRVVMQRCSSGSGPVHFPSFKAPIILVRTEPPIQTTRDYIREEKNHLLRLHFGRPSVPPNRPLLLDLFEDGRPTKSVSRIVAALAEYGGVSFFRSSASRTTLVTWTPEAEHVWLARWKEAAEDPEDVQRVNDLPVD